MKGTRLKELREQKGETQAQLADVLDVSQQAVGKWELDKASPDDKMLIKIANHYGVTIDYLLGYKSITTALLVTMNYGNPYIIGIVYFQHLQWITIFYNEILTNF